MLLNQWLRVFYSDNGTITDLSLDLQSDGDVNIPIVAAQDYIYIAQSMPFNNFFMEVSTPNDQASVMSIETWDGVSWKPAVDVLDGTSVGGVSLARDGVVQFSPDRDEYWDIVEDTRDEPTAFGLQSSVVLFDSYFIRISFSSDLNAGTDLNKIGYLFASSEQLNAIDPEIDNYLTSWGGVTKTDWSEQLMIGSQMVVSALKSRGMVFHRGQILRLDDVSLAAAYRTLVILYTKFGEGFETQRADALDQFKNLLSIQRFSLDQNSDGELSRDEQSGSVGRGVR